MSDSKDQSVVTECSVCLSDFDYDLEGGVAGYIGMIYFALCPSCTSGMSEVFGCDKEHCEDNTGGCCECQCGN